MTKLSGIEAAILLGVLDDIREAVDAPIDLDPYTDRFARGAAMVRRRRALEGEVSVALGRWLGHQPTDSETTMASRAYRRLEELGLLERVNPAGKTHALVLLPAGKALAEELSRG